MFTVLGMALPVVFVVGLYKRKSVPVMTSLPAGLVANRPVSGSPVLLKTCAFPHTSASAKLFGTQKGDVLTLQISTGNEPEKPDVLVYWVPGTPSGLDKVPYERRFVAHLDRVPEAGKSIKLVEAGNHAQGCVFRDGERLITPALEERIDQISQRLNGFYIGRYDIRFQNEEDLCAGRNFQIIELNGAASEATNIYDARNSLWSAYQTLFTQWKLVFAIGAENRRHGFKPMGLFALLRVWHRYARSSAQYPVSD